MKHPKRKLRCALVPYDPDSPKLVGLQFTILTPKAKEIGTLEIVQHMGTKHVTVEFKKSPGYVAVEGSETNMIFIAPEGRGG